MLQGEGIYFLTSVKPYLYIIIIVQSTRMVETYGSNEVDQ